MLLGCATSLLLITGIECLTVNGRTRLRDAWNNVVRTMGDSMMAIGRTLTPWNAGLMMDPYGGAHVMMGV